MNYLLDTRILNQYIKVFETFTITIIRDTLRYECFYSILRTTIVYFGLGDNGSSYCTTMTIPVCPNHPSMLSIM